MSPITLEMVEVEQPCPVPWVTMRGTNQIRFCDQCRLNVYNLTEMTNDQIQELLAERGTNRLCIRYYQTWEGKVITRTQDCDAFRKWKENEEEERSKPIGVFMWLLLILGPVTTMTIGSHLLPWNRSANSTFSLVGGGMRFPRASNASTDESETAPFPRIK